jgi:hypothetical protein
MMRFLVFSSGEIGYILAKIEISFDKLTLTILKFAPFEGSMIDFRVSGYENIFRKSTGSSARMASG